MKISFCLPIIAMLASLLSGCNLSNGSSADPPSGLTATAGDGRVKIEWVVVPGVDYWLFTATDPSLTAFNWTGLPNAQAYINAATPYYMCGLFSGTQYYFAMNGRKDGGPGGSSSPTITTTVPPYNASTNSWTPGNTPTNPDLYGAGYTSLKTCSNNSTSASGSFAAVGAGGAIFTSSDGNTWVDHTSASPIASDLYAVTGYSVTQNSAGNQAHWVAVGAGGVSINSIDGGATWTAGNSSSLTNQPLHSVTQSAGTFVAVGDAGTILSSTDGISWTTLNSIPAVATPVTTENLNGIAHGSIYVVVGDNGTVLTSSSAGINTWTLQTAVPALTTNNLRQVASVDSLIVAVGNSGTIVTSRDGGATWTTQNIGTANDLVGVVAEPLVVGNDVVDGWLGAIPKVQFVAIDISGNIYRTMSNPTATNGLTWSYTSTAGVTPSLNIPGQSGQLLVSSGFGYIAVGNAGATAHAF